MAQQLELTRRNRLRLARAFQHHLRVDYSIDCVIEGQMGKAFADDADNPSAYYIQTGSFRYYAGDAGSSGGRLLLDELPVGALLMPSPPDWLAAARQLFGERLAPFTRYRFSAHRLSDGHLGNLLTSSPYFDKVVPLDCTLIAALLAQPGAWLEISEFDSPIDFIERGMGFAVVQNGRILGAAYSSLVCSRGIEVSVYVEERSRQRGVATAAVSCLLVECLRRGILPNWDAAGSESFKLAKKLGFVFLEAYDAYYQV